MALGKSTVTNQVANRNGCGVVQYKHVSGINDCDHPRSGLLTWQALCGVSFTNLMKLDKLIF